MSGTFQQPIASLHCIASKTEVQYGIASNQKIVCSKHSNFFYFRFIWLGDLSSVELLNDIIGMQRDHSEYHLIL